MVPAVEGMMMYSAGIAVIHVTGIMKAGEDIITVIVVVVDRLFEVF